MTVIVGCSNAKKLTEKISRHSNLQLVNSETKKFPDGETYVRINENLSGEKVVVIQSGYPNQNDSMMELFLTLDAVKDMEPEKVYLVFGYMPYSKQDKRFKDGETVSAGTVLKLAKNFKITQLSVVNLHFAKGEQEFDFLDVDIKNVNAAPLVAQYVKEKYGDIITILPGKGASHLLNEGEIISLETRRDEYTEKTGKYFGESNVTSGLKDLNGKNVLVLDDMINTGGTMAKICELAKKNGANKVVSGCIHGIFAGEAIKKLENAKVDEIVSTDTIENKYSKVSVAHLLAEEIMKI